jgi:hypothetical protein
MATAAQPARAVIVEPDQATSLHPNAKVSAGVLAALSPSCFARS